MVVVVARVGGLKQRVLCFWPRGCCFSHLAGSGYEKIGSIGKFKQIRCTVHVCRASHLILFNFSRKKKRHLFPL